MYRKMIHFVHLKWIIGQIRNLKVLEEQSSKKKQSSRKSKFQKIKVLENQSSMENKSSKRTKF